MTEVVYETRNEKMGGIVDHAAVATYDTWGSSSLCRNRHSVSMSMVQF